MAVLRTVYVRYEELKRELVGKTPEEVRLLIEKYKEETGKILEDFNPHSLGSAIPGKRAAQLKSGKFPPDS